jgi:hypothetical protein
LLREERLAVVEKLTTERRGRKKDQQNACHVCCTQYDATLRRDTEQEDKTESLYFCPMLVNR